MNEQKPFYLKPDLLVQTGSHLYGCAVATSDQDTRGFVCEPAEYLLGRKNFEQHETKTPDHVVWGLKKFFKLLEGFSPNTVEILFAPKEHVLQVTEIGQRLLDHRHLFIAKRLVKPMQRFALSEWKKAVEYHDQMRKLGAQRKGHIAEFGYSIKNAYHAIRLLEECIELLETGSITFPRPNADFLRKIRHGQAAVEEVEARWNELDKSIPDVLAKSTIPDDIDKEKTDALYYTLISGNLVDFMRETFDYPPEKVAAVVLPLRQA